MFDIKVLLLINNYYLIRFLKNKYISYKYKHILTYSYYYFIISININYIGGDNIVFNECVTSVYLICMLSTTRMQCGYFNYYLITLNRALKASTNSVLSTCS